MEDKKFSSFHTSTSDALNETAASSRRLTGIDLESNSNIPIQHRTIDLTAEHANAASRQNPFIVHPSYSQPHSTAFSTERSIFGNKESAPQQVPGTRTGTTAGPMNYLPPQQFGGVLDELRSRDKFFRIQLIENELYKNRHSCYKVWMLAQPVIAAGVIYGLCSWIADPSRTIPSWPLVISVLLLIWNAVQSIVEFLAIKQKKFSKASKALKSFCLYITVLFISTIAMSVTVFNEVMADAASEWRIVVSIIVSFGVIVLFYLCNLSGAVKVYQILKRKWELQQSVEEESKVIAILN